MPLPVCSAESSAVTHCGKGVLQRHSSSSHVQPSSNSRNKAISVGVTDISDPLDCTRFRLFEYKCEYHRCLWDRCLRSRLLSCRSSLTPRALQRPRGGLPDGPHTCACAFSFEFTSFQHNAPCANAAPVLAMSTAYTKDIVRCMNFWDILNAKSAHW